MNLPATGGEESVKTPISENSSCAVAFPDAFAAKAKPNEADGESKTMIRLSDGKNSRFRQFTETKLICDDML